MAALVGFIATYLGAALFQIADGIPFAAARRALDQLRRPGAARARARVRPAGRGPHGQAASSAARAGALAAQWGFDIALGIVMAIETLWVLEVFEDRESPIVAASMAVAVVLADERGTRRCAQRDRDALDRDSISGRRQLLLYGLALLFTLLSTELGLLQRILGTTSLTGDNGSLLALAAVVLLVGEVIKFVQRMSANERHVKEAGT